MLIRCDLLISNVKHASPTPTPTPSQLPRPPLLALTATTTGPSSSPQSPTEVLDTHGPSLQMDQDTETPTPPGTPPRSRVHGATPGLEGHPQRVETDAFYTVMVVWDRVPFPNTDANAQQPEWVGSRPKKESSKFCSEAVPESTAVETDACLRSLSNRRAELRVRCRAFAYCSRA